MGSMLAARSCITTLTCNSDQPQNPGPLMVALQGQRGGAGGRFQVATMAMGVLEFGWNSDERLWSLIPSGLPFQVATMLMGVLEFGSSTLTAHTFGGAGLLGWLTGVPAEVRPQPRPADSRADQRPSLRAGEARFEILVMLPFPFEMLPTSCIFRLRACFWVQGISM